MAFFQVPDARRIRSFFTKLPLATRLLLVLITAFYVAKAFRPALEQWGALIPQEINIGTRKTCARAISEYYSTDRVIVQSTASIHTLSSIRMSSTSSST